MDSLHEVIMGEKHQYRYTTLISEHMAMVSLPQAFADAMAILTVDQRQLAAELLATLPQTARVPSGLVEVKPHEIVERILAQRAVLNLTGEQVTALDSLHVAIRDEKHQYRHTGGKPHGTQHQRMITRSQAFADAMAILTPDQRLMTVEIFTLEPAAE